jgi:group I intron endonuclease
VIIYCITNLINGKMYIGQHIGDDLSAYWKLSYESRIRSGLRGRPHLFRAMRKYGIEKFSSKVLIRVGTKADLDYYERKLIAAWKTRSPNGYNLTDGGGGGQLGFKASPETIEKKRLAATGRKHTEEWKRMMSKRMRGNKYGLLNRNRLGHKKTDEQRAEISRNLLGNKFRAGVPHSREVKDRIRDSCKAHWEKIRAGLIPAPSAVRVRGSDGKFAKRGGVAA